MRALPCHVPAMGVAACVVLALLMVPSWSDRASAQVQVTREIVASGLAWPVSFAFAPDGRILYNERYTGRIRAFANDQVAPGEIANVSVVTNGEQGLLGLALDPDFSTSPWVYVYHTHFDSGLGRVANRVLRISAGNPSLAPEVLLDPIPAGARHNGGILGFARDGTLFITTGDATVSTNSQDNASLAGKILRINRDGTIPADNPIPGSPVYSLGHRNVFGLDFHPVTGQPYVSENGPTSDDEVNLIEPGRNYGWPLVTGDANDPRFVDPIMAFATVIAPTGLAFYTGDVAAWQDSFFLGDWNRGVLQRIELAPPDYRQVVLRETIDTVGPNGILDVEMGPDGYVYFSTTGTIYRLRTLPPPVDAIAGSYLPLGIGLIILAATAVVVLWWIASRRRPRS